MYIFHFSGLRVIYMFRFILKMLKNNITIYFMIPFINIYRYNELSKKKKRNKMGYKSKFCATPM